MRWIPPLRILAVTTPTLRGACLLAGLTFFHFAAFAEDEVGVFVSEAAVTIDAENTSIRRILESFSEKAGLVVHSDSALDEHVTVNVDARTVHDAISHILRDRSYVLLMTGGDTDRCSVTCGQLWVFSDANGDDSDAWSTGPTQNSDLTHDIEWNEYQLLAMSTNDVDREKAMFELGEVGGQSSFELLQRGLSDSSRRVREAAIESLADIGGAGSISALGIALSDPDAGLRISALDALGEIGGKESIRLIQQALNDEESSVREASGNWLTELNWRQ